jgi:hypothetical protein
MDAIISAGWLKSMNLLIVFFAPPAIALILFALYVVYSSDTKSLAPTLAFTTLSLFNTLRFPLVVLPKAIKNLAEALAALRRIQTFLLTTDVQSVRMENAKDQKALVHALRVWCSSSMPTSPTARTRRWTTPRH